MRVFVFFLLLVHVSQHALAAVVQVYEGEPSTLLSCQFYDHFTRMPEDPIVSWIRNDLNPKIIHQFNDDGDDLKKQNERYKGRTSMKTNALDSGDFSLILKKPQKSDSGKYTCTIWMGLERMNLNEIQLQVKDDHKVVKVQKGVESVRLPCKTSPPLPEDTRVEWTLLDPVKMLVQLVHVYQNKSEDLTTQTSWNHTEMNKDLLKTGDLSLTIKYPTDTDRGTYICTFYVKGNTMKHRVEFQVVKGQGAKATANDPSLFILLFFFVIIIAIVVCCLSFYMSSVSADGVQEYEEDEKSALVPTLRSSY